MFFTKKQPSFDESPLQDLSTDQLSQISGGAGISLVNQLSHLTSGAGGSLKSEIISAALQEWKKLHPNAHLNAATVQEIIKLAGDAKNIL
jgi:hypothetical protein